MATHTRPQGTAAKSTAQPYSSAPRLRLVSVEQTGTIAEGPSLRGPDAVRDALKGYFACKDREHFVVLHLDSAHQVVSAACVSIGTLSFAPVHPREVFKAAILANAAAIICAHNHPSGALTPSDEDRGVFDRLSTASSVLGIPLLDFLIIGGNEYWSAIEHGGWPRPSRIRL